MSFDEELLELISQARAQGATVHVDYDRQAEVDEGRILIAAVQVVGLKGCGPHPMPPLYASERLRECLCSYPTP